MRLNIVGTKDKLPLEITNRKPQIIRLEGGTKQKIVTGGGKNNGLTRQIVGISKGNFVIDYQLDIPVCSTPGN